ncbi:hypothetical protein [Streptomyces sp. NPDC059753]|uniref:hypothetical protein n=1 Tax=Streptomyces sp. NPDC059753 TaxID=3346933 RepID=UPI00365DEED6
MGLPQRRGPNSGAAHAAWSAAPTGASRLHWGGAGAVGATPAPRGQHLAAHPPRTAALDARITALGVARECDATCRERP